MSQVFFALQQIHQTQVQSSVHPPTLRTPAHAHQLIVHALLAAYQPSKVPVWMQRMHMHLGRCMYVCAFVVGVSVVDL